MRTTALILAAASLLFSLPAFATPVTPIATAESEGPGFYPGRETPVISSIYEAYLQQNQSKIAEIEQLVDDVHSGRVPGGCIGNTINVCIATLAQSLAITTMALPRDTLDPELDDSRRDVNGVLLRKNATLMFFYPKRPSRTNVVTMFSNAQGLVTLVSFTTIRDPLLADSEDEYDKTGVYDLASSLISTECLGGKVPFYRIIQNEIKPARKTERNTESGPGFVEDSESTSADVVRCGYKISVGRTYGISTQVISEDNLDGSFGGGNLGLAAAPNAIPVTPDFTKLRADVVNSIPPGPSKLALGLELTNPVGFSRMMLHYTGGALVFHVVPGSVAAKAGLHWADILLTFDGKPIPDADSVAGMAAAVTSGRVVPIELYRNRTKLTVQAQF